MEALTVYDLMTVSPITVPTTASLRVVLVSMKEDGVRQLPVLDEQGRLTGIITDRDVRLAMNSPLILHDRKQDETLLDTLTVESCMTPDPITISPHSPAYCAAELLSVKKFGALPVVDGEELIGILSVTDILDQFAANERERTGASMALGGISSRKAAG